MRKRPKSIGLRPDNLAAFLQVMEGFATSGAWPDLRTSTSSSSDSSLDSCRAFSTSSAAL